MLFRSVAARAERRSVHLFIEPKIAVPCGCIAVKCQVAADGGAVGFDGFDLRPCLSLLPDPEQGVLDDVLCFLTVEGDAESQPEELVLEGQYVVAEPNFFHRSIR